MRREQVLQVLKRLQKEARAHAVTHDVQRSDARNVQRLNEGAQIFVRVRVVRGSLRGPVEDRVTRARPVEQKWLNVRWETSQGQELTESAQRLGMCHVTEWRHRPLDRIVERVIDAVDVQQALAHVGRHPVLVHGEHVVLFLVRDVIALQRHRDLFASFLPNMLKLPILGSIRCVPTVWASIRSFSRRAVFCRLKW